MRRRAEKGSRARMKVGAVEWLEHELTGIGSAGKLLELIRSRLLKAEEAGIGMIVLPAFTGCLFQLLESGRNNLGGLTGAAEARGYLEKVSRLSEGLRMTICPGSYFDADSQGTFHQSCLITDGRLLHTQRQLYLSRWERTLGLSRGAEARVLETDGWRVGIVMPTDAFYPQVSRMLAMNGVGLVLAPSGITGPQNETLQLCGMWRETQLNQFFAAESCYNGRAGDRPLWGESRIHAPLGMTEGGDGFLARSRGSEGLISAVLNMQGREEAITDFNVLRRLNAEFYRRAGLFGGEGE